MGIPGERNLGEPGEPWSDLSYMSYWPPGSQDYGTLSNYSTLKSGVGKDYDTLSRSGVVSEEELER